MRKLYITDLDHTFLHSSQEVSSFSKTIWNEKSSSAILSIATARSFSKTHEFLEGMHLNAPLILLDGAMVVTTQKEIIDIKTINKHIGDAIIEEGTRFGIYPFVISLNNHQSLDETFAIPQKLNHYQDYLIKNNYATDTRLKHKKSIEGAKDTLKIVYMGEESTLRPLSEHLEKVFGHEIEIKLAPENYMQCMFLTILHPLSDKAHGLKKVHEYLNVDADNTTVFGDGLNDLGMFKLAGTAIAVSNALDSVKKEANIILKESNDEDAVAKYLQKNILS